MSVIFQLFCAEDLQTLKRLAPAYLEDLKATLLTISSNALPDLLKAGLTTLQSTYEHPSPQVTEAIKQRAYDVFEQLKQRRPSDPSSAPRLLNSSQSILDQLFSAGDLVLLDTEERKILAWAISCEVANRKFYDTLETIRNDAYTQFRALTGQLPKGPDSSYSPFNPLGPIFRLYNNPGNP